MSSKLVKQVFVQQGSRALSKSKKCYQPSLHLQNIYPNTPDSRTEVHPLTSSSPCLPRSSTLPSPQVLRPQEVLMVSQCRRQEGESPRISDLGSVTWLPHLAPFPCLYFPSVKPYEGATLYKWFWFYSILFPFWLQLTPHSLS